jgi:hypothetical protein
MPVSLLAGGTTYYSCPDFSISKEETAPLARLLQVDPGGFEPPTFSMPLRRAPNCAMGPVYSVQLLSDQYSVCSVTDYCLLQTAH